MGKKGWYIYILERRRKKQRGRRRRRGDVHSFTDTPAPQQPQRPASALACGGRCRIVKFKIYEYLIHIHTSRAKKSMARSAPARANTRVTRQSRPHNSLAEPAAQQSLARPLRDATSARRLHNHRGRAAGAALLRHQQRVLWRHF